MSITALVVHGAMVQTKRHPGEFGLLALIARAREAQVTSTVQGHRKRILLERQLSRGACCQFSQFRKRAPADQM